MRINKDINDVLVDVDSKVDQIPDEVKQAGEHVVQGLTGGASDTHT